MKTTPVIERILRRVDTTDPNACWIWQGATLKNGYGYVSLGTGKGMGYTHRVAYEHIVGPIGDGLVIDHLCRNRACCNPMHLEPVTLRENLLRGEAPSAKAARRDSCIHGHPYTEENTYLYRGARHCRTCKNHHRETWRQRRGA